MAKKKPDNVFQLFKKTSVEDVPQYMACSGCGGKLDVPNNLSANDIENIYTGHKTLCKATA